MVVSPALWRIVALLWLALLVKLLKVYDRVLFHFNGMQVVARRAPERRAKLQLHTRVGQVRPREGTVQAEARERSQAEHVRGNVRSYRQLEETRRTC